MQVPEPQGLIGRQGNRETAQSGVQRGRYGRGESGGMKEGQGWRVEGKRVVEELHH